MEHREAQPGRSPSETVTRAVAGHVRFRTEREPGIDPMRRRWEATYAHRDGWSRFAIALDLAHNSCTLFRSPDGDYRAMLRELAGKQADSLTPIPPPTRRLKLLTFDMEVIGLRMSRINSNAGSSGGDSGDWLVIQAFVPGGAQSFLLGINDRLQTGEIVTSTPDSGVAVFQALSQVFG